MDMGGDRRAKVAIAATFFVHGLLFASWTAHVPEVRAHVGAGDGALGLALLGIPAGSVAAVTATGRLVRRLGSRRTLRLALAGFVLSGPVVGLTGSLVALLAALAVWGAFMGVLDVAMNTQAATGERRAGQVLMPGFHGSWSVGALAGAGLGALGVAAGVSLSWQLLLAGVPLALAVGWLSSGLLDDDTGTAPTGRTGRRLPRPILLLAALSAADMLCEGSAADWSAVELRSSAHAGAGVAGIGYAAFALGMVAVRLAGNRLVGRFSASRLLPALCALATATFAIGLAFDDPVAVIVGWAGLGIGLGAVVPITFGAAARLDPAGIATVAAIGWTGFVCGPPVIGALASLVTLRAALVLVPVLTAAIALIAARSATLRQAAISVSRMS